MSIFTKITIVTIATIILSSVASSSIQLNNYIRNIKDRDRLLIREAAERIENFMLDKYNMMYNQRTLLHSTGYICDAIASTRNNPSDIYQLEYLGPITDYLTALCYSDDTIKEAVLFTADGQNAFSHCNNTDRKIYLNFDYNSLSYVEDFKKTDRTISVIYDEKPSYLTVSSKKDPAVITLIGKLYDLKYPTKKIVIGYLMINFSPDSLDAIYKDINASSDGEHLVINQDSRIIYSSNPAYIDKIYDETILKPEDIFFVKSISLSGLQIISAVSDEVLMKSVSTIIQRTIYVTGISVICLAVIITILHKYYRKRFNQLDLAMNKISRGDFDIRLPIQSKDEIGKLSECFNNMSETLNVYIKKTFVAETQKRTAELYALQAQINPHFLTNTIESIRMRALTDGNYELSEMLANLGNLFRWMIQFHQDIVYLDDEIEYINSYMELQTFRFEDRLETRIDLPNSLLFLGIPKFTIQPIVENALTHGLPSDGHPIFVHIYFECKEDTLYLTVTDNGTGIEKHTLNALQKNISGEQPNSSFGIALSNVHKRIQLLFGEKYGLSIQSEHHMGTTVTVTLPALPKKEMERYVQDDYNR